MGDNASPLPSRRETLISVIILGTLFFIFGFISWVNAILIPYFRIAFELKDNIDGYLVTFAFYISYFIMSVPAGFLLERIGFKRGMMTGFLIMAAGAFLFVPSAWMRSYTGFLTGLFTLGTGLAILQTAANPYITIIGPRESAARRLSIMGICNKGAGILAPLAFAAVVLKATDTELFRTLDTLTNTARAAALDEFIQRVILPYTAVGIILLGMALIVRFSPLPEIQPASQLQGNSKEHKADKSILQFPHLVLGAVAIFLHVGTQVISIDTIIGYAVGSGMDLSEAKVFPSYTLTATIIGYIAGISLIPERLSQRTALRICTVLGLILSMLILLVKGKMLLFGHTAPVSIWFIVLLGLANSLVWAGVWPLALDGLGSHTKRGASLLIMGLCGNALMPLAYGWMADRYDLQSGYIVLIPCYVYLCWYAFHGHRLRKWSLTA